MCKFQFSLLFKALCCLCHRYSKAGAVLLFFKQIFFSNVVKEALSICLYKHSLLQRNHKRLSQNEAVIECFTKENFIPNNVSVNRCNFYVGDWDSLREKVERKLVSSCFESRLSFQLKISSNQLEPSLLLCLISIPCFDRRQNNMVNISQIRFVVSKKKKWDFIQDLMWFWRQKQFTTNKTMVDCTTCSTLH